MIWLLMCLAVIGIAWFMFVPRFGRNETLIPSNARTPTAESPPGRIAEEVGALTGGAHPAHVYETGAHATGAWPNGQQSASGTGLDAYVAAADTADTETGVGVVDVDAELAGGLTEGHASGTADGLTRE